ncbi:PGF-pre-PGF domain-containing protein [Haloarcula sp. S1CR25-12]|uniref:PGF-pre-PGF domain-containing protein n=1 Tax=Haloarcula saliterrae TaxID=2950534 RepID=A0ABU2F970_9EURY|nr:PGF-pre-PGF domain-containing protein [Haloarcula sp. S1CR25-12]MDS0258833.1 PGF-pre-PGF domain-containing protein [Haloarcula sp. S1CR25-12]
MQLTNGSQNEWGSRIIALGLVVLVVGSMFASVAAAVPAMGFRGADVSATTVAVGENVTVSGTVVNVGSSGGGYTMEFTRNRTPFAERRVKVPSNEDRTVNVSVQFDQPGTYKISVNDNRAGYVTVKRARARVTSESDSQRRVNIRANSVSDSAPTELAIPASNRSFALERWSTTTGQSAFQQNLTEYTNRSAVPGELPTTEQSSLLGVVTYESNSSFEQTTMRFAVNKSAIANTSLRQDQVAVYQRNESSWDALETTVVEERTDRMVYEATATRGSTYAVGLINPSISVASTTIQTESIASGERVILNAVVENTGPVTGTYTGALRVNGETVNETTLTVAGGGETGLRLTHDITESGTYDFALNNESAGRLILSPGDVASSQSDSESADAEPTAAPTATPTEMSGGDGGGALTGAIPATVFGIKTLYLGGGIAIALGAFIAILAVLRRNGGGGGGGGRPDSFDQF